MCEFVWLQLTTSLTGQVDQSILVMLVRVQSFSDAVDDGRRLDVELSQLTCRDRQILTRCRHAAPV